MMALLKIIVRSCLTAADAHAFTAFIFNDADFTFKSSEVKGFVISHKNS